MRENENDEVIAPESRVDDIEEIDGPGKHTLNDQPTTNGAPVDDPDATAKTTTTALPVTPDIPATPAKTPATPAKMPTNDADLFDFGDLAKLQDEWHTVQASFVDDPETSVRDADALVGRMVDTITSRITEQRTALSQRGDGDGDTEELRQALRRYRTMFQQLLPNSH